MASCSCGALHSLCLSWLVGVIRLARFGDSFGDKPGDNVGELLVGERLRGVRTPVRHALVGTASDGNAAKILITDEGQIGRVDDGAEFVGAGFGIARGAFSICSVATCAGCC